MTQDISFPHPEPAPATARVWPVFLPFAGCPYRCVYCAQDRQTGQGEADLETILDNLEQDLDIALDEGRGPYELAFYGGTFTALPGAWTAAFLNAALPYRQKGLITRVRCSTRPDAVDEPMLAELRDIGLDMVELGVQSFDDGALKASGRGYTGDTARQACGLVKQSGLALGIQLMPGLPGDRPGMFHADVRTAAYLRPEVMRLYPCLVIRDTPLADIWQRGGYVPWTLPHAREELAEALPVLWEEGIRVIRLGLPPEGTLAEHILAGPWHPALGQSARGIALLHIVQARLTDADSAPLLFEVPRRYQGELFGHAGELTEEYATLGLTRSNIRYTDAPLFKISFP